jgi:FkbM family methyltransferase
MKNFVQAVFGRLGYRITKLDAVWKPHYGLDNFFPLLKGYGFAPKHIIDVGANRGDWTRKAVRYFPDAQYTLVEPQDYLKKNIEDLLDAGYKIKWVNAGAGEESGVLAFTVSHRHDSSTFAMSEDEAREAGLRQIPMRVKTLNEIAGEAGAPLPEMVKIDAEGFDLNVLAGASDLLGKTDVFLVESCVCSNGGPNTVLEVLRFMDAAGYRLVDVTDLNRSPKYGVLWLSELAFLRKASPLLQRVTSYE